MSKIDELRAKLADFNAMAKARPELELAQIERWMVRELGVLRIETGKGKGKKKGKGTIVTYFHPLLRECGRDGYFTVHKCHQKHKNREMISDFDYKKYLQRPLGEIIDLMEVEEAGGTTK